MLKKIRWLLLPLLALAPLSAVHASGTREGAAEGLDVHISMNTLTAWGSMGTARLEPVASPGEPDDAQDKAIGCSLDATAASVLVRCSAFNPELFLGCVSGDKNLVSAVAGMSGDSFITFTVAPDHATCLRIQIDNNSMYQQKAN
jgi:hypothetical protein